MKEEIITYLKSLRDEIIKSFESLEKENAFQRTLWDYTNGQGGGEISQLRGKVFEKAAVNWSGVYGNQFPGNDATGPFFATGVSLITHMFNPHMPTVHMNVRYIETEKGSWFAGGYDLTPMGQNFPEDIEHFHSTAKNTLDQFDKTLYPAFFKNAKEYFYIPHRKKERGAGGIFFDHYNSKDPSKDILLWKAVGSTFLDAIMPIYKRRIHTSFDQADKERQLQLRSHYVEFNLLYDRGTKFGFLSGGNPEAILCSMPPHASW